MIFACWRATVCGSFQAVCVTKNTRVDSAMWGMTHICEFHSYFNHMQGSDAQTSQPFELAKSLMRLF